MSKIKFLIAGSLGNMLIFSCASIVGTEYQTVPISSSPSGASITIVDEKNVTVFKAKTPTRVVLQKSDGTYFGGKRYVVEISKRGYRTVSFTINSYPNGWYWVGNLLSLAWFIGWLAIDPYTGKMYSLSPTDINSSLGSSSAYSPEDGSVVVTLLEDVPDELKAKMKEIRETEDDV